MLGCEKLIPTKGVHVKLNLKPTIFCLVLISAASMTRADRTPAASDALDLSLEELMGVVVTSVSKKPQTLAETAAAVYVITAEDIRRSGATNIPEALRLAPGVQVAAIGHNKWAVSIRGFADRYANKLLVLVDGRSVYTPLFSGVQWEALGVPLESIERIEVIRGPGASVWGANAVNGVINILTQSPFDAQGGRVTVAAGNELKGHGYGRYGWSPDPDTALSLYAEAYNYDASKKVTGGNGVDDWKRRSAGFKLEHLLRDGTLHLQGSATRSDAGDELALISAPPAITRVRSTEEISTSHLLARWENRATAGREESLQAFVQHEDYEDVIASETRTTADLEFQQRLTLGGRHDLTWGLGYRYSKDNVGDSQMLMFGERYRHTSLYSLFAQDEVVLQPERWRLSVGARLEHNDYTDYAIQPNLRLLWTPDSDNSVWISLTRAIRTPSRIERGAAAYVEADPAGQPFPNVVQLISSTLGDERLNALDLGWRHQFSPYANLDWTAFYYRYDDLRGAAATTPEFVLPGYILVRTPENHANSAEVFGSEVSLDWRPVRSWRLQFNYSWLRYLVHTDSSPAQVPSDYADLAPVHQLSIRSSLDFGRGLRWDAWLRHVSRIERYDIPEFTTLDMRFAWQARKDLEVSLVGQNLLDSAHPEFGSQFFVTTPSEVERGVYARLDWKF